MKYAIDKIEDNIVTLENLETKEIENISMDLLPKNIKEGTIIKKTILYEIDKQEEQKRRTSLKNRFHKLKK